MFFLLLLSPLSRSRKSSALYGWTLSVREAETFSLCPLHPCLLYLFSCPLFHVRPALCVWSVSLRRRWQLILPYMAGFNTWVLATTVPVLKDCNSQWPKGLLISRRNIICGFTLNINASFPKLQIFFCKQPESTAGISV